MDYEKAYKKALERAITIKQNAYCEETKTACDEIFPELQESEDDRTRKELIETIRCISSNCQFAIFLTEEKKQRWLTYLEKQKELPTNEEMLRTLHTEYEKGVADTIAKYEQRR